MKQFSVNEIIKAKRQDLVWDVKDNSFVVSDGAFGVYFTDEDIFEEFRYKCKKFERCSGLFESFERTRNGCTIIAEKSDVYLKTKDRTYTWIYDYGFDGGEKRTISYDAKYIDLFKSASTVYVNETGTVCSLCGNGYVAVVCGCHIGKDLLVRHVVSLRLLQKAFDGLEKEKL